MQRRRKCPTAIASTSVVRRSTPAMSNPYGLLSQILCHCLNQGRTLNDILMRAAH